jgi:hypothetical protein
MLHSIEQAYEVADQDLLLDPSTSRRLLSGGGGGSGSGTPGEAPSSSAPASAPADPLPIRLEQTDEDEIRRPYFGPEYQTYSVDYEKIWQESKASSNGDTLILPHTMKVGDRVAFVGSGPQPTLDFLVNETWTDGVVLRFSPRDASSTYGTIYGAHVVRNHYANGFWAVSQISGGWPFVSHHWRYEFLMKERSIEVHIDDTLFADYVLGESQSVGDIKVITVNRDTTDLTAKQYCETCPARLEVFMLDTSPTNYASPTTRTTPFTKR